MPSKVRIDAPGALHHIIARGIERRKIFFDSADRDIFLKRLWVKISENGKKLGHGYGYPSKNRNSAEIIFAIPKTETILQLCFNPCT